MSADETSAAGRKRVRVLVVDDHPVVRAGMVALLVQGLVEILRCIVCLRDGEWPSREQDVEEVDVDKLKAMVTHEGEGTHNVGPVSAAGER